MLVLVHPQNDAIVAQSHRRCSASSTNSSSNSPHRQHSSKNKHPPATTTTSHHPTRPPPPPSIPDSLPPTVNIHSYPTTDLLKLLASLLTQIASTNDQLAASPTASAGITSTSSTAPLHPNQDTPIWHSLTTASRSAIATPASTLTFHARNIPTISLDAYFLRILKYCPTTNEVFLALLVYFDRMSKLSADATGRTFVIDSYNIHRLVIAGVTVASKFFSDVFYTNSRYAKVGGLPLSELNQLELQFLLLNDFRLVISSEEMQRYAEQLVLFSRNSGLGGGSAVGSAVDTTLTHATGPTIVAAPMSTMGAIDAYGGRVVDWSSSTLSAASTSSTSTSAAGPSNFQNQPPHGHHHHHHHHHHQHLSSENPQPPILSHSRHRRIYSTTSTSTSTTEYDDSIETETDGGGSDENGSTATGTTDDEPTIRAASFISRGRRRESIDEVTVDHHCEPQGDDDDDDEGDGGGTNRMQNSIGGTTTLDVGERTREDMTLTSS